MPCYRRGHLCAGVDRERQVPQGHRVADRDPDGAAGGLEPLLVHGPDPQAVDWEPAPGVTLEVFEDPASGWNVHATPTNFTLTPAAASGEAVDGEGHMHIYAGDTKLGRMYSEWIHLGSLPPGTGLPTSSL